MQAAVACLLLIAASATETGTLTFTAFIEQYGRSYIKGTQEFEERQALFDTRASAVQSHNDRSDRLWTAAINHLSDWNDGELKTLRGWKGRRYASATNGGEKHSLLEANKTMDLPEDHSWSKLRATKMQWDQGPCGSCWAVATVSVLQAHSEIYRPDTDRQFAVQELVNCVENPDHCGGEGGCRGATVEMAMDYIMHNGLSTPKQTPYRAEDGKCRAKAGKSSLTQSKVGEHVLLQIGTKAMERFTAVEVFEETSKGIIKGTGKELGAVGVRYGEKFGSAAQGFGMFGWERLAENAYEPLLRAVAERGPVAISASASGWFSYSKGIFNSCEKDVVVDHAVTLIGYGKSSEAKYWTIKNSWGPTWGEGGFIRVLRQEDAGTAQCGTDTKPEVGTGCDGGPSSVKVCGMCGILYDSVVPHFVSAQSSELPELAH